MTRVFTLLCLLILTSTPVVVNAATLTFGGTGGSVGSTIAVPVLVNTEGGESLNAVAAYISYPKEKLSLVSISKSSSIVTLWAQEPSFSNAQGTASLEGIVPNPGFTGQSGRVVTLSFKVLSPGPATLSFGSGTSILANDGKGTNILSAAVAKTLTLTEATTPAPAVKKEPVTEPSLIDTSSPPLLPPDIQEYVRTINEGDALTLRGTTYPKSVVGMRVYKGDDEVYETTTTTDARGDFTLALTGILDSGEYSFVVWVIDGEGNASPVSTAYPLTVQYVLPLDASHVLFDYVPAAVALLLGIAALFGWIRVLSIRHRLFRSYTHTTRVLHKSFALLKKDIREHARYLRQEQATRPLSKEEIAFLAEFEDELEEAETLVKDSLDTLAKS